MVKIVFKDVLHFPHVFVWSLNEKVSNSNVLSSQQMASMDLLFNLLYQPKKFPEPELYTHCCACSWVS